LPSANGLRRAGRLGLRGLTLLLLVATGGKAEAQLGEVPFTPPLATVSAIKSSQQGAMDHARQLMDRGDRAFHNGDPVAALEIYNQANDDLPSGLNMRADVQLRIASAEASLGQCPRAMGRLDQMRPWLGAVPERAATRQGIYQQVEGLCTAQPPAPAR
jgi:hypothetical protein